MRGGYWDWWQTIGWAGIVRVDGTSYTFLGDPAVSSSSGTLNKATQNAARFTATMSVFEMTAGSVDVNVTFLSPVEVRFLSCFFWVVVGCERREGG